MVKKLTASHDAQDVTAKPAAEPDLMTALGALEQEAGATEQAGEARQQQAEAKEEQQEIDTLEADLLSALNMAAAPAQPAMWWLNEQQFEDLWGQKVRKGIAESGAVIMRRHGLSLGGLMAAYGPYIGLLAAVGPSVAATVAVYKAEKQKQLATQGAGHAGTTQAG